MRPVGLVSLPHFSRLQNDPQGLRGAVASCIRITLVATVPSLMVLAACSPWVLGLLGDEWTIGTTALKLLCVVGIAKGFVFFTGPLLFAVDRPRLRAGMLWLFAAISAVTVVAVGSLLTDSSDEAQLFGMSASRALVFVALIVPLNLVIVYRVTGLRVREIAPWALAPVLAGAAALAVGTLLERGGVLDGLGAFPALVVAASATGIVALAVLSVLDDRVRTELHVIVAAARSRTSRERPAA